MSPKFFTVCDNVRVLHPPHYFESEYTRYSELAIRLLLGVRWERKGRGERELEQTARYITM